MKKSLPIRIPILLAVACVVSLSAATAPATTQEDVYYQPNADTK